MDSEKIKNLENSLKESKTYSEIFFNNHTIMILIDPTNLNIVDANTAAANFYGYTHDELLKMKISDINVLSEGSVKDEMNRAISDQNNHFIFKHRLSNGEIRDVDVYSGLINYEDKNLLYSIIHDITEQKKSEIALRNSEELFRLTFDQSPLGAVILSRDYQPKRVNKSLSSILGYTNDELLRMNYLEYTFSEDLDGKKELEDLISGEIENFTFEKRFIHKNGETVWGLLSLSAVKDEKGKIVSILGMIEDITGRKKAEFERETSVEFLRLVNESKNLEDLIHSTLTYFKNQSGCEAVGIRLQEEQDYPYYQTSGFPDEFIQLENYLCDYDKEGKPHCDSTGYPIIECMCGNVICKRYDPSQPFFTDNGSFWTNSTTKLLATSSEEDRQNRTRNRCNGEGYESVALIPIHSGVKNIGLLQLNDRRKDIFSEELIALWERMTGYLAVAIAKFKAEKEIIGKSNVLNGLNQLFQESLTYKSEKEVIEKCLEVSEKLTQSEFGFFGEINKNGRLDDRALSPPAWSKCETPNAEQLLKNMEIRSYWGRTIIEEKSQIVNNPDSDPDSKGLPEGHPPITSFLGVPLKQGETIMGMIALANKKSGYTEEDKRNIESLSGAFVEVLMRKRAEIEINENLKKLEQSNKELEQFAYITSHDLREPLRMITSFLQLLERRYKDKLDKDAQEFIGFAVDGAKRLDIMTNDLLLYSRITTEKRGITPVNFEKVLEEALINLKFPIEENNTIITHDPLPIINGDAQLKVQLFQNIIGNAIKYRSMETPKIHISAIKEKNQYLFTIKDNGIGMSPKHLERIFTIFKRLHTHDEYEGTGIGLAIAQKIITQQGGQIWAESEIGKGSTFYFTIPIINDNILL